MDSMRFSIVVPCYNEEKNLDRLIRRFDRVCKILAERDREMELVLVDNGSLDGTHAGIQSLAAVRPYIKEVRVKVNQGYGFGILQGLAACTGRWLCWTHADLQSPPEAILEVDEVLAASVDPDRLFLKGRRRGRPFSDRFFTFGMSVFESLYLGRKLYDINAQPTCIPRSFYETWEDPPHDFSLDLYAYYMAVERGLEVVRVPVKQSERREGKSSWNTGLRSRVRLIVRTVSYSRALKRELAEQRKRAWQSLRTRSRSSRGGGDR